MTVWYSACAPATPSPASRHPSQPSSQRSGGATTSTRRIAMKGTIHSADLM